MPSTENHPKPNKKGGCPACVRAWSQKKNLLVRLFQVYAMQRLWILYQMSGQGQWSV